MSVFKIFNAVFFRSKPEIRWFDKEGVLDIGGDRLVKIRIETSGNVDYYTGYRVEILNKHSGVISSKWFPFREYLRMVHREGASEYYHAWYNRGGLDWYISHPMDTKDLVNPIFEWINFHK
jgi:hypothetical protein